jgi:ribose transport system ATP-binding protein
MKADDSCLSIEGVSMAFDDRLVLRDVNLEVRAATIHGLIGHNGSGKSTLVRILAGYHRPASGTIRLGGDVLPLGTASTRYAAGLRFVHQDLGLVGAFDALENFGLGGEYARRRLRTIDWRAQERSFAETMESLHVEVPVRRPVSELSAVQQTLIAVARATRLASDGAPARALILDEPTARLEGPETEELFRVLRKLAASGLGVIYISHNLTDVLQLCSAVTVLRDGHVVATVRTDNSSHEALVNLMLGRASATLDPPARNSVSARDVSARDETADRPPAPLRFALSVRGLRSSLLRGVDLDVSRGECVCVLGASGSGREDLVYAIAGAIRATGAVDVGGTRATELNPARSKRLGLALVPGNRLPGSIVNDFTVRENITFAAIPRSRRLARIDRRKERREALQWIDKFDIKPGKPEQLTRHLSGGNKQKAILAKWISIDPVVMLIDEPTAGVDIGAAEEVLSTLRGLADTGTSLVVTTSEIADALRLADRVIVLHDGEVGAELRRGRDELTEEAVLLAMSQYRAINENPGITL